MTANALALGICGCLTLCWLGLCAVDVSANLARAAIAKAQAQVAKKAGGEE